MQHPLLPRLNDVARIVGAACLLVGTTAPSHAQAVRCVDAQGIEHVVGGVAREDAVQCADLSSRPADRSSTRAAPTRRATANADVSKSSGVRAAAVQVDDRRWLLEQELAYQRTIETQLLESRIAPKSLSNDDDAPLKRVRANIVSLQREIARLDPR